jgi:hypothetical protein
MPGAGAIARELATSRPGDDGDTLGLSRDYRVGRADSETYRHGATVDRDASATRLVGAVLSR